MDWFTGPVENGIAEARRDKKLLIVFVTGGENCEKSSEFEQTLTEETVTKQLDSYPYMALRLEANSVPLKQFGMIYPVVVIPAMYFIGENGVCLETALTKQSLVPNLEKALAMHKKQLEAAPSAAQVKHDEPAPSTSADWTKNEQTSSLQDRVSRAQQLSRRLQDKKASEELEKERQEEKQRRSVGRAAQQHRQRQEQLEVEEMAKERRKQKSEDRLYRERLRQQMAADRAEQQARQRLVDGSAPTDSAVQQPASSPPDASKFQRDYHQCRLQFRLPDGSTLLGSFAADQCLGDARQFLLASAPSLAAGPFHLSTIYPRRIFDDADYDKSMKELDLLPSTALRVLAASSAVRPTINANGQTGSLINMLISPLMMIWTWISYFFGSFFQPTTNETGSQPNEAGSSPNSGSRPTPSSSRNDNGSSAGFWRREAGHDNVARFHNQQDDEKEPDDQAMWNGNSTQFK